MELWLAIFGLVAAVIMIWMSRNRHRDATGSGHGAGHSPEKKAGNWGGNDHGSTGDGGDGGGGGD
jgi:hypothetical protein